MRLTALGIYAPYPPAGGATSGYLLSGGGTNMLLDCGSGIVSRLQSFVSLDDIDAVILSHLHGDHIADIGVLRYMPGYRRRFEGGQKEKLIVYAPDTPKEEYGLLRSIRFFDVRPVKHGMTATTGCMHMRFFSMEHPYPCFGVRIECEGKVFAFSGDTVMNANIAPMIKDADLLLCDSSFLSVDRTAESTHLSAAEAAALSRAGGVKRLILTHYAGADAHLAEAKAIFGSCELAREMETYEF